MDERQGRPRVFVSYARESKRHIGEVRKLVHVLRRDVGIDARWDNGVRSQDWTLWMTRELAAATHILLVGSPEYKRRGDEEREDGYGVEWEGSIVRLFLTENDPASRKEIIPVALPADTREDFPLWVRAKTRASYKVETITREGLADVARHVTGQEYDPLPPVRPEFFQYPTWEEEERRAGAVDHPAAGVGAWGSSAMAEEFDRALLTFKGRRRALRAIAAWLRNPADRRSLFVTSGPGSGKTALLGLVAHLARGPESLDLVADLPPEDCLPPEDSINVALYAQNMVPGIILNHLARAAGMPSDDFAQTLAAGSLADARDAIAAFLEERQKRITVLIDALDEVSLPREGEDATSFRDLDELGAVLMPLITDPDSRIRFLFGGRDRVLPHLGFDLLGNDDRVIDLDGSYVDADALREHVGTVLKDGDSPWQDADADDIKAAVDWITEIAIPSFYLGEKIASSQARLAELPDPKSELWRAGLPHSAGLAIREELQARFGTAEKFQWAVGLLLPLAYARGVGIPWAEVWLPLANALRPDGAPAYTRGDFEWIRTDASSYVVGITAGRSSRSVYRLYHRSFGDFLRKDERYARGAHDQTGDERTIVRALLPRPSGADMGDTGRRWDGVSAYVRDHLLEHAAASGDTALIDELVFDPGFLVHGRDVELRSALGKLSEPRHRAVAAVYGSARAALLGRPDTPAFSTASAPSEADAREMLAQLSLAARCRGIDALADRVKAGSHPWQAPWRATWAAWRRQPPHVRFTGHSGQVRAVVTTTLGDVPLAALTGGDDGVIRVWDVLRGVLVMHIPTQHGGIMGLAAGTLGDGRKIVVSTGSDRAARVWDLSTGEPIGPGFGEHRQPIHAVVVRDPDPAMDPDREAQIVTGDDGGTVRVWDPLSGMQVRRSREREDSCRVTALALIQVADSTRVVAAYIDGLITVWNMDSKEDPREYRWHRTRAVRALAIAEHGGRPVVVSAGDDGAIYVWDPSLPPGASSSLAARPAEHRGGVWALAVAETEGRRVIISAGQDRTVRVWDIADGTPFGAPFTGHEKVTRALAVAGTSDRVIVVSGGDDAVVEAWDLTAVGANAEAFAGHLRPVRCLLFTQIGGRDRLLSGSGDGTVRRWDPDTGALVGPPLEGHRQKVAALAFATVGGRECVISGGTDTTVRIRDAASGEYAGENRRHPAGVTALLTIASSEKVRIVSACSSGVVQVWGPDGPEPLTTYARHEGAVRALAAVYLSPSAPDPLVVSAGKDGELRVWRPESGETLLQVPSGHREVTTLAGIPGYPSWLVSGGPDGAVRLHDLARGGAGVQWDTHPQAEAVRALAAAVNGGSMTIVSAHADGTVRFRDAAGPALPPGAVHSHTAHDGEARALAVGTVGGRPVVFSGGDDHLIKVWDVEHKAQTRTPHRSWVRALAVAKLAPDKNYVSAEWTVLSGSDDDTIQIRDLAGRRPGRVLSAHHRGVRALTVPDGDAPILVSGGVDHRLRVWDLSRERAHPPLDGHDDWVRALDAGVLPGGERVVVSASGDGDVRTWDLSTMSLLVPPRRLHSEGGLRAVAIGEIVDAGGERQPVVVTGGMGRVIRVSRLRTGEIIGQFREHRSGIRALAVTRLGPRSVVLSGDDAGVVWAWDLKTCETLATIIGDRGEVNAIATHQRGYGNGCTWVAVGAGESVVLLRWTAQHGWEERTSARFGCQVLGVALPDEAEGDEPPGPVAVAAAQGVVVIDAAGPVRSRQG